MDQGTAVAVAGGGAGIVGLVTWFLRVVNTQKVVAQNAGAVDVANAGNAALIAHYTAEVTRLNGVIAGLSDRLDRLEEEKQKAEDDAHLLDKQVALQDQRIGGLLVEIRNLNDQVRNRESDLTEAEKRIDEMEKTIKTLERRRPDHAPRPEMDIPLRRITDREGGLGK